MQAGFILPHLLKAVTKNTEFSFSRDGWPLDATGQPYTRDEIVADESIPYPRHVNPANPSPYWRRRTPAELAAEKDRAAKKAKAREKARANSRPRRRRLASVVPFGPSAFERDSERRARATGELVRRANERPDDQAESRSILLNLCGQFHILEVANV